jgi:hypothetical protein
MNFRQFSARFSDRFFLSSKDILALEDDPQILRNQLNRWVKADLLIRLKKGLYVFSADEKRRNIPLAATSSVMLAPSYISLEYALGIHGLIPEYVADVTAVTTLKPCRIRNILGTFVYRHLQSSCFRGFQSVKYSNGVWFLAEAEKAVVDFLYFQLASFKDNKVREILEGSYRFQNIAELDAEKIVFWGKLFNSPKLIRVVNELSTWIREEKQGYD